MQAPSHTSCGRAKAAKGLGLHYRNTITYSLWEGKGSKRISKKVCTMQAPSLTLWGKAKAARGSARRSALCKHHHLQTVGRQRQQEDQQGGLHYASTITYFLWEGKGSKRISRKVCTMQAPSLTV